MAKTYKLEMKFGTMSGVKTWTFSEANEGVTQQQVTTAMQAMINNGSIYKYPPMTAESARLVITDDTSFDVSGVTPASN